MIFILWTVVAALVIGYFLKSSRKPKNFPPGPPKLPLIGSIPYLGVAEANGSPLHIQVNNSKKYGKIWGAFIGSEPIVYLNDHELAKKVMGMDELNGRPEKIPFSYLRPGIEHPHFERGSPGIVLAQGQYWRDQRRFALRNLRDRGFGKASMEESLLEEVDKLFDFLRSKKNEPVDLTLAFNVSIINALWMILMGERLPLSDPRVEDLMNKMNDMMKASSSASPIFLLLPKREMMLWPGLKQLLKIGTAEKAFQGMYKLVEENVQTHEARLKITGYEEEDSDFMDTFLKKLKSEKGDSVVGRNSLLGTFVDLLFAGSETTSSSLVWTMLYMIHHPKVQEKVQQEIDMVVGASKPPSLADSDSLPYVNAVLQESFRLTGLGYGSVPHRALDNVSIEGYSIPKGATVMTCLYDIMRNPERYENPDLFMPERYIDASGKFIKDDHVTPFGIGKRYCLGQSLAEKEFFLFFAGLMQNFTFKNYPGMPLPGYGFKDTYPEGPSRTPPANLRVLIEERQ